jgi:glycosyltransferase involved in cell wall biosynthesis
VKISIITVCFNSADTVEGTIRTVLDQTHGDVEHVIVDGGSTDGTLDILAKYRDRIDTIVSEPDEGIYDAMNKGIRLATGQMVGCLNADDIYADENVIADVAVAVESNAYEGVYGDLVYVPRDDPGKVLRYWKAGEYLPRAFHVGWVPPHPTFFCRRSLFERFGYYNALYRIAGDFELMLRLIEKHRIRVGYIPRPLVRMRVGGRANTIRGMVRGNREILNAFAINGLKPSLRFFWQKPFVKIGQLARRSGPRPSHTHPVGLGTPPRDD